MKPPESLTEAEADAEEAASLPIAEAEKIVQPVAKVWDHVADSVEEALGD